MEFLKKDHLVKLQLFIKNLAHGHSCDKISCTPNCDKMKRLISHLALCTKKPDEDCYHCSRTKLLCGYHAKACRQNRGCDVPYCETLKFDQSKQQLTAEVANWKRLREQVEPLRPAVRPDVRLDGPYVRARLQPFVAPEVGPFNAPHLPPAVEPQAGPSNAPHVPPAMEPEAGPSNAPHVPSAMEPEAGPSNAPHVPPAMEPEAGPSNVPHVPSAMEPEAGPSNAPRVPLAMEPKAGPSTAPYVPPAMEPNAPLVVKLEAGPEVGPSSAPHVPLVADFQPALGYYARPLITPASGLYERQFVAPGVRPDEGLPAAPVGRPNAGPPVAAVGPYARSLIVPAREPITRRSPATPARGPYARPSVAPARRLNMRHLVALARERITRRQVAPAGEPNARPILAPPVRPNLGPVARPEDFQYIRVEFQPFQVQLQFENQGANGILHFGGLQPGVPRPGRIQHAIPQPPAENWRQTVSAQLRQQQAQNLVNSITRFYPPGYQSLIEYGNILENILFGRAHSLRDYYHMIGEEMNRLPRELEEHLRSV